MHDLMRGSLLEKNITCFIKIMGAKCGFIWGMKWVFGETPTA
jgi:hypothetical protein